jgi:predicted ester cyclase
VGIKENKELVRRFFNILDSAQGDIERFKTADWDSICSSDYVIHFTNGDMNLEQFIQYNATIFTAFPDMRFAIDDMIAEGDKVAVRYTLKGTFKKEYQGIIPTGKQIVAKGVSIERIVKGRDVETWDFPDMLSIMTQLGAIPKQ